MTMEVIANGQYLEKNSLNSIVRVVLTIWLFISIAKLLMIVGVGLRWLYVMYLWSAVF